MELNLGVYLLLVFYWKKFVFSFMLQLFEMSLRQPDVEATGTVTNHNVRLKLLIAKEDNPYWNT